MSEQDIGRPGGPSSAAPIEPVPVSPLRASVPDAWAVGTPLFFIPIRYWEAVAPETGRVVEHTNLNGERLPNPTRDGFVYAHHDGYGHPVYMQQEDCRLSSDDALAEIERRTMEKARQDKAEFDAWWLSVHDELFPAQAIEARRAETGTGSVHESAVPEECAPTSCPSPSHREEG